MHDLRLVAAVALGVIVCTGCGSDSDGTVYSADATAACLTRAGAVIGKGPASIGGAGSKAGSFGSNTGLSVLVMGHRLVLVFHRTAGDARETERLFQTLDKAVNRDPERLSRRGTAVMFWDTRPPTSQERAAMHTCLRPRR